MSRLTLRPYPEYRESGVPWLGRVPAHWAIHRAKHFLYEVDERSITGEEERLSVSHITGVTPRSQKNVTMFEAESYVGHKLCRSGDVVANTMWTWMGAIGVSRHTGIVSPAYGVYRPRRCDDFDPRFLDYLLRTPALIAEYVRRSTGIQESRLRLYAGKLLDIPLPCPPISAQHAIARFLDAHHRVVRRYGSAKRSVQGVLAEQAGAFVAHVLQGSDAVAGSTKSWPMVPLRRIAAVRLSGVDKHTVEGERPIRLCNYTDVYRHEQIDRSIDFMRATATEAEIATLTLERGDVIITKDSESWTDIAVPALVVEDLPGVVCGYHLALLRPDRAQVEGEYLYRVLTAPSVAAALHVRANGVTRFGLSQHAIKSVRVPLPPLDVQREICAAINEAVGPLATVRSRIEREVALMIEYRARLVADVVLGRVDPRAALEQMEVAGGAIPEGVLADMGLEDDTDEEAMGVELDELVEAEP